MSWKKLLLLFVVLVPVFNVLTVLVLPTAVNHLVLRRIVEQSMVEAAKPDARPEAQRRKAEVIARGATNVALPAPRADASARTVVRPSPDLLYTACVFDLGKGPLHITAPVQDGYVSVSGFSADSSNFFAVNDRNTPVAADGRKRFDLLLTNGEPVTAPEGARVIVSPSTRGLVLFRSLIPDEAALPQLIADYQVNQRCDPL
ncbi:MAG: DUF1254 domain-containing protein [Stagnimonas sp.]|nr:DUF1254 domain-containing protein [Stagnimonas sp.]